MPIDTSIYQNIKPVQIDLPSPIDTGTRAMSLAHLGLQNKQAQYQMAQTQAVRDAFAKNTDANGVVNKQGVVSYLGKMGMGQAALGAGQEFAAQEKSAAEAKGAQADAAQKMYTVTGPAFDYLKQKPEDVRAQLYPKVIQSLKDQGIDVSKMDHPYDSQSFDRYYGAWQNNKDYLAKQVQLSEINKNNQEPFKTGAEELGKLNEDANNPTSRKTSGGLKDIVNRADRIVALANAGAPPNETPEARTARLNKIMPQIAKEFNVSLATIMQGGIPTEGLNKELGTDTVDSAIAGLKQRFSGAPEGANQAAMIQQYVDTAQHLRNFASQRLQSLNERSKAAYPYAAKYFPGEVSKIISPDEAPAAGSVVAAKGGSGLFENRANAAEQPPRPAPLTEGMIRIKGPDGKIYRIPQALKGEAIAGGGSVVK